MKYKVKWNYKSSLGGPWLKGNVIDLREDMAEAINRDSPGVLEDAKTQSKEKDAKVAKDENRMVVKAEGARRSAKK